MEAIKISYLGIFESAQLSNDEKENGLDLCGFLVRSVGRKNTQNVRDAAGNQQLNVPENTKNIFQFFNLNISILQYFVWTQSKR